MDPTVYAEMAGSPAAWNGSVNLNVNLNDIQMDSNFVFLLTSLISAMVWVIYITYYNSRVIGYFATKLLNRLFVTKGFLHIGSLTINVLSGKIMFRDIIYITNDYTVRIQDGWVIFRWWRSYVPKDVSEDLSHSDTRLSVMLNGFELHFYNRCGVYANLEKVFGLDPQMFPPSTDEDRDEAGLVGPAVGSKEAAALSHSWRDLIPVVKLDVASGRVVFGNRLVPTTLSITVEEAHFVYSTKPAASRLDHFMHFVKCKAENFKVILAPSPKYTGMVDEPPRFMGEGFVVLSSNNIELYYYMDEAGAVPEQPEMLRLANGDIVESAPPIWGIDIKCGKGTDFSYGPWADRQREHLFKFFFPADFQPLKVTKAPQPGEKRLAQCFDIRLSTLNEATVDILFSKNKETNAVHINVGPGSYLEVTLPWVVLQDGFTTKITGQLLHLEATTSLQYRSLVESETLEFTVKCHYPVKWNDHQEWLLTLTGCKATVHLIFAHKWFFQDLLNDWSSKARPDLLHFVPYTWKITLLLKEFEVVVSCNEYNWIDCSSQNQENVNVAFSGDLFDLSFDLPFCDFLPTTLPLRFWLQGESVDLLLYLPEVCTSRSVLLSLDANAKILGRDGQPRQKTDARRWRNVCMKSDGWVDCWSVQIIALCINYVYHPCPPLGPPPQADITTPEKEEILLSPIRIPHCRKSPGIQWTHSDGSKFEPSSLPSDKVSLELEMGPSVLLLYGSLIRNFLHLKENIFGDDQTFTDMQQSRRPNQSSEHDSARSDRSDDNGGKQREFDPRDYRPLDVNVSITMHDIQAHLVKNCTENDPPCPMILLERFGFEMKKEYRETKLQLLLSPAILLVSDKVTRPGKESHLTQGHLMLSGFQIRDHAMFSSEGRSLDEDTLEYGWLLEGQLGKLSGKLTAPQLHHLITSLETFLLLALDDENHLRSPGVQKLCHHNLPPLTCPESDPDTRYRCPSSNEIKYKMNRLAIDTVDLYLLENSTALHVWASPIRVSTCNLHGHQVKSGVTGVLPAIRVRQFISTGGHFGHHNPSNTNTGTTGSGRSHNGHRSSSGDGSDTWLEVGSITLGPLVIEAAISLPTPDHNLHLVQQKYLRTHDEITKRLWFLWPGEAAPGTAKSCGCIGGCAFFGSNRNGAKFFKPSRQDLQDGVNMAAFRIHEPGRDPGFGQSILHEGQLVFHTPPYTGSLDISLQPDPVSPWAGHNSSLKVAGNERPAFESPSTAERSTKDSSSRMSTASPSPVSCYGDKRSLGRRFSYTSIGNRTAAVGGPLLRDVPYSRLVDHAASKLDSDSRLHEAERGRSALGVPDTDQTASPKCSLSDSRLAVDYFQTSSPSADDARAKAPLDASESHHSLSSPTEEQRMKEVQRTTSMSSENHSEAFYSADEDMVASRTSSLRNSVTLTRQDTGAIASRKKFASEMSILPAVSAAPQHSLQGVSASAAHAPEGRSRLSSHRSDHEIHTPEHRNLHAFSPPPDTAGDDGRRGLSHKQRAASPRYLLGLNDSLTGLQDVSELQPLEGMIMDSSDTHSISSTSFISAMSSQEDVTLVNLHMQVNKPIIDSPLLMSSYVSHLSQVGCSNWAQSSLPSGCDGFTVPLFHRSEDGRLVYIGGRYTPRFETLTEGFTSLKMIDRTSGDHHASPPPSAKTPTHPYAWDSSHLMGGGDCQDLETGCEEELLATQTECGTRTTIIIKLKGDIDIMVSPLVLESLQRFIDAVTPTLASLHPLTVINHLHLGCIGQVEAANILKRDQSLSYLSQFQASSKRSTAERISSVTQATQQLLQPGNEVYQESIATQVQGTLVIAKVNITLLQASVVEEIISFSALDNIRDLTCVSLFAVCFDGITARFHRAKQAREAVETFHRPAVLPSGQKKNVGGGKLKPSSLLGHRNATTADTIGGEPVYIETSEKQQEETIVVLSINKIHAQLRRLRNESSILKDAVITAIPTHYSKVLFTCARVTSPLRGVDFYLQPPDPPSEGSSHHAAAGEDPAKGAEDKLGFIMFETGLEGVSLKIVKRSKFERGDNDNADDDMLPPQEAEPRNYDSVRSKDDIERGNSPNASDTSTAPQPSTSKPPKPGDPFLKPAPKPPGPTTPEGTGTAEGEGAGPGTGILVRTKDDANTSSCVIEFKVVWFNFAAPPRAPITRKIDFTRLDWNLLSTASPAINAWMNPSNRFAIRVVHMFRSMYRRSTAIVACLMADALDVQTIHMPIKSRYGRYTPLAKTLQEDPSCQLCNVLQKYVLQTGVGAVEENLREGTDLPQLITLRQGVIVLSRQWKNVLYTPLLLDHKYKAKRVKPLNVTFAAPEPEEENVLTDGENSGDDCEITDECAMLINTPAGQVHRVMKAQEKQAGKGEDIMLPLSPPGIVVGNVDSLFTSPSPPVAHAHHLLAGNHRKHKSLAPSQPPTSSRASIVFPILAGHPFSHHRAEHLIGYGSLKEDRTLPHLGSNPSLYSQGSQPSIASLDHNLSPGLNVRTKGSPAEDLYSWMAKQQDFIRGEQTANNWESKLNTLTTEDTSEEADYLMMPYSLYPMHDSLRLLDAHLIFEPLLSCLGVMPRQMMTNLVTGPGSSNPSSFDTWGTNLSLVGAIDTMRIDIVVSEFGKTPDKKKGKTGTKANRTQGGKFFLDIPPETPAFLCEKMGVELDLKKMADMTVDDLIQKQKVLYISRGQLKKHTSTTLNFALNVRYISQQVNMPLLRLLHQISNMYQNVKETQNELREQQPEVKRDNSGKNHKNGSSSTSDVQERNSDSGEKAKMPDLSVNEEFPLSLSQQKILSPSSTLQARPQSFAQKLRSTGKSVKGYMNLSEGVTTPNLAASPSGSGPDRLTITPEKGKDASASPRPRCWKTVYYLLDLYATMPETKTITHRFSVAADIAEVYKTSTRKYELSSDPKPNSEDVEKGTDTGQASTPLPERPNHLSVMTGERTRLIVFGVARIHRTRLLATLSGLKLEAEITSLHASLTCRKKSRPASLECSLTGQVGRTMIVLLEGVAPNQQTVVKVTVGKSQALYSSISRRSKDKNSGLLTVGAVNIDIPQHPVALHGMMTRGSKQLSSTLQELRVTRTTSRPARAAPDEPDCAATQHSPRRLPTQGGPRGPGAAPNLGRAHPETSLLLQPLVMQFSIILQSLSVTAALLPSLQAQYKMDQVTSSGVTGSKAKFTIDLPRHSLSFTTKLQVTEANLPSEASIELPKVHVKAEYIQDGNNTIETLFADGVVLRQGSYLSAVADIGVFEHSLTTDLLNHLVFVQKVFMREVNEVVQKVYGGEKPVSFWEEDSEPASSSISTVLFSLAIRIKRIQLTATTPTNSAVRLETGAVEFQLSNRVQNVSGAAQPNPYMKIFGKAQVDVNLSLGQLIKNVMFEEAEPEFQQFAFFKTRIGLRNAFQDEMVQGKDKEVVLITLKRPLIYIQPMAVDKAILVWLNYKNAYEYWNEQRSNLNKEVLTATQQVLEKVPFGQLTSQLGTMPSLGTLFLQLTVEDMGICLPLNPLPLSVYDAESRNAVVVTLESTSISACSSGSLVSKGRFVGLCLRFADDFETSLDDWKPDMSDGMMNMNLCVVSDGTYEVCSRTIAQKQGLDNAKWFLNVAWQMEGVDIHLDVNVGKQLSSLGHTLTMLTGSQEADDSYDSDEDAVDGANASQESISLRRSRNLADSLPAFVLDPTLDAKKRSKLIEKEMNEQAKIINDLRSLGASHGTIEQEMKRLHELEAMVFKDFRRDMIQKLRRQSVKASSIKGKFGLGSKSNTYRSRSFIVPSPTPEHHLEMESPDDVGGASVNSNGNSASFESSPRSGPSRSASLRVRGLGGPRVTFSDTHNICRQSSLPSAGSDLSLPEGDLEWNGEHMDIDGEKVELRRKPSTYSTLSYEHVDTSPRDSLPSVLQKPQEPNIDFELDVKVLVNRGKCVLHTKDPAKEDELKLTSRMKKERSCSGGMFDFPPASPNLGRRNKAEAKAPPSSARLRYMHGSNVAQLVDLTIFHIPGLDVKVHYESKTIQDDCLPFRLAPELGSGKKSGTKKASLFAWMTLQSIPEETIISPHILEFLEQTLEPIPAPQSKATFPTGPVNTMFAMEQDSSWASTATVTGNYVYASFPVDVIVYFHMQPSTFRFSCLPVSRVECMLQLPSLDIVFSSKRAEEELHSEFEGLQSSSTPSSSRFDMSGASAVGGLSVTGCLADFSVYIFHPYGGGKKSGHKEAQWSPLADSERKDSLSVNVEFVKFHLSRSRKLNFPHDQPAKGIKTTEQSQAVIRFSTIVDIGSASFKYDMRRLTEILAFPKAWYRRSIVRRLFLGDLSFSAAYSETGDDSPSSVEEELLSKSSSHDTVTRAGGGEGLSRSVPTPGRSPMLTTRERLRLSLENDISRQSSRQPRRPDSPGPTAAAEHKSGSAWETLVLFAVNFTRLNVHMNMGNVMGNVMWLTKDFRSDGRLSIGSTGHKNMYIGVGLGGSSLDAKGGIVGGTIELSKIDTYIHIREDPGTEPDHTVGLKLFALELRLDYMGTGVLMARVSSLAVSLRDEWKIHRSHRASDEASFIPTRRPAMIFMHGDLGWDQLQLMISKSTTADLLKMFYKLEEFFSQQFKSSKRVFSSLQPRGSSFKRRGGGARKKTPADPTGEGPSFQDARHHRHWQRVLQQVAGLHLSTLSFPLPLSGTVLGGTMELHGNNISLACFHGINFKSKSWALFSLKEPCISFATEAQDVPGSDSEEQLSVHVVQTLTFSLGMMSDQPHAQHHSMATVCRLSRNVLFPPQFRSLQEWFHYAFTNSEIDAVDRFPSLEREKTEQAGGTAEQRARKLQDPNHTREVIFALPSLQLHLKTEHLQAARTPETSVGQKPMVECSFITEFEDHIFVTVDAEAFFFLHDLITSYVKEKERVASSTIGLRAQSPDHERRAAATPAPSASASAASDDERKRKAFDPAEMFTKDWRNYHCKTWHLEPTVRLLSWAGKSIEPYGIDYILQKLGFSHARTTIPKWMQRGFMDPLDKVLAVLVLRMVAAVREEARDPDSRDK